MSQEDIDSLLNQLKSTSSNLTTNIPASSGDITKEQLEQYVIHNSTELINQSLEIMNNVKDYAAASGDPDSISALSDLVNASSKALDTLNKIVIQNKRSEASITAKAMDIQGRYHIEEKKNESALIASREEMFKLMMKDVKDVESESNSED